MDFFNVGTGELLVLLMLGLILFGPEDIVNVMRTLGKYVRTAQRMWVQVSTTLQEELISEEARNTTDGIKGSFSELQRELEGTGRAIQGSMPKGFIERHRPSQPAQTDAGLPPDVASHSTEGKSQTTDAEPSLGHKMGP